MPGKDHSGFGTTRRLPAAVIFLALALCLALPGQGLAWQSAGSLNAARQEHTATLLPNGKVLVVGGWGTIGILAGCELYDPATNTWTTTGPLITARYEHTATLLPNGKVLVVGGWGSEGVLNSAELYDPGTGSWSPAATFTVARQMHTATLLPDGRVLVAGGRSSTGEPLASALLYAPDSFAGSWGSASPLTTPRNQHTATLLHNGTVLVAGGENAGNYLNTSQIYTPNAGAGSWASEGSFTTGRYRHTATVLPDGRMLLAGGEAAPGFIFPTLAEIYTPGSGWGGGTTMPTGRKVHTATLLPNGQVLLAGGYDGSWLSSAYVYNGTWGSAGSLATARIFHTATLLPNGKLLVTGGRNSDLVSIASCELYDYAAGSWSNAAGLSASRSWQQATLMANGQVMIVGGNVYASPSVNTAIYDPASNYWSYPAATLHEARLDHTVTLLANGKVLVAGGRVGASDYKNTAELYDGSSWNYTTGNLSDGRYAHTATLLGDGRVLVAGGTGTGNNELQSVEIFDPNATSNAWTITQSLTFRRCHHTATLLPGGTVMVAGGEGYGLHLDSVEIYNPASGTWSPGTSLPASRRDHTATLLPSGKVLVAGGIHYDGTGWEFVASTLIYDPAGNGGAGSWTATTGSLNQPRYLHKATLLPDGRVLVVGGNDALNNRAGAEIYDPATGLWTVVTGSFVGRYGHTATLLPTGKVLVVGGWEIIELAGAQLFDPGLGFSDTWRPTISSISASVATGGQLTVSGAGFRGLSGGSGGLNSNDSPTDYPLVQVRRLDSERLLWALPSSFSSTSFTSRAFQDFQTGYCLVTVFASGIPSVSKLTLFNNTGPPTAVELASFTAAWDKKRVVLKWETYTEKDNFGFYLWRTEAGQDVYTRLTQDLIPARGSATMGAAYSYEDRFVVRGQEYLYKLEDVDRHGASTFHGPVSATAGPGKKTRGSRGALAWAPKFRADTWVRPYKR
jgi:hypothetical protein